MSDAQLIEELDRWVLPLSGSSVARCCIDWSVTLQFNHQLGSFELRIEQPFVLQPVKAAEMLLLPEEEPVRLAPVLAVIRTSVEWAAAFKDGHLELTFTDGSRLSVPAAEDYESWELVGPDGLRVVSVPGGELSIWHSHTERDNRE